MVVGKKLHHQLGDQTAIILFHQVFLPIGALWGSAPKRLYAFWILKICAASKKASNQNGFWNHKVPLCR